MIEADDSLESSDLLRARLARAEEALDRQRKRKTEAQAKWRAKKQRMGSENARAEPEKG